MNEIKTKIHYQLGARALEEQTVDRDEGVIDEKGTLVIKTGKFTGRSPADKFIVKDGLTEHTVDWNKFNNPIAEDHFQTLKENILTYLDTLESVWIRDVFACADSAFRLSIRLINEQPYGSHFAANMFIAPTDEELIDFKPEWTIIHAPGFHADPLLHGTRQGNFTIISFSHQIILIGGSGYTGEIKKGMFSVLNFILPRRNVLSMHCSANEGPGGDTALFFGLSGTGKTTLSSDPARRLIGDDEHGWSDNGVFNIEGGCYAKVINLSSKHEPDIFNAIRAGALVENTCFVAGTRRIDFMCKKITENTRVSYPLNYIRKIKYPAVSGHPKHIFFLTCDAWGVFPPISKLDNEQAMYYFINGYTAKIAGTEEGIQEPQVTFSACFGAPFLPLKPAVYANMLREKLETTAAKVWLVNTGWTGGGYGTGTRISLTHTRAMISAALAGKLDDAICEQHPVFGLLVPQSCPGVPNELLNPVDSWTNKESYYQAAMTLREKFDENYRYCQKGF